MDKKYILSYGGGVNSSALFFYILEKRLPLDLVIFADTGEETDQTYKAVERLKTICIAKNIEFVIVSSDKGRLVDYYMRKKAVPSIKFRDCTSKFKIAPIRKYLRSRYGKAQQFIQYIGIAFDELHRARYSDVKYIENSYPFVTDKINRAGNIEILKRNGFEAAKSGCAGCPYMNKRGFMKLKKNDPETFKRWLLLEQNGSRYPEITLNPSFKLQDIKEQTTLVDDVDDETKGCGSYYCFI